MNDSIFEISNFERIIQDDELSIGKLTSSLKKCFEQHHHEINMLKNELKLKTVELSEKATITESNAEISKKLNKLKKQNTDLSRNVRNMEEEIDQKDRIIATLESKIKQSQEINSILKKSQESELSLKNEIFELNKKSREEKLNRLKFLAYLNRLILDLHSILDIKSNVEEMELDQIDFDSEKFRLEQIEKMIVQVYSMFKPKPK